MENIFDLFNRIHRHDKILGQPEFIICFLGNPGAEYENTRHNIGFKFSEYLENILKIKIDNNRFDALTSIVEVNGKKVLLLKPQTYMNLSGNSVSKAMNFYKISPDSLIVVSDDISLDYAKIRIRKFGSDGGHNGLKNIIALIGTDKFVRIRIGVGIPDKNQDIIKWVLGRIPTEFSELYDNTFNKVYSSLLLILDKKIENAMSKYNG